MIRLHGRDDAEFGEARDVGPGDRLDVLDAMASLAARVRAAQPARTRRGPSGSRHRRWRGSRAASRADPPRRRTRRAGRLPLGQARGGVVLVRGEHVRRPGLDDPVREGLEDAGVQPLAAAQVADDLVVLVEAARPLVEGLVRAASSGPAGSGA